MLVYLCEWISFRGSGQHAIRIFFICPLGYGPANRGIKAHIQYGTCLVYVLREQIGGKWARQDLRERVVSGHPSLFHLLLHMDQAMAG